MGESITTRLDIPYNQHPDTRDKAVRVMQRLGAAGLIEVLGLTEPAPPEPKPIGHCAQGHVLPSHGVCRRARQCRADARKAGVIA